MRLRHHPHLPLQAVCYTDINNNNIKKKAK